MADIFYPIFTLAITILACFVQKQLFGGLAPMPSPRHCPRPPGGLTAPTGPPATIVCDFAKYQCTHIFYVLSHGYNIP